MENIILVTLILAVIVCGKQYHPCSRITDRELRRTPEDRKWISGNNDDLLNVKNAHDDRRKQNAFAHAEVRNRRKTPQSDTAFQAVRKTARSHGTEIKTEKDILLRVNRPIQAAGTFTFIKQDMKFCRFMLRGIKGVA